MHKVVDMWHVNSAIIVLIIVPANSLMVKSFALSRLSLGEWTKGLIQIAILDAARIVRRFLSLEP